MIYISTKRVVFALVAAGIAFIFLSHAFHWVGITSPYAYPLARKYWAEEDISHFPYPIPKSGRATNFYYSNGPVQAGKRMILTVQHTEEDYLDRLNFLRGMSATEDGQKYGHLYAKAFLRLDDGGEATVLHATPTFYNAEVSWNHGRARGFTLYSTTYQIEYWAESW